MAKKLTSLLAVALFVVGCSSPDSGNTPQPKVIPADQRHELSLASQPAKTVIDYFKWYDRHRDSIMQFPLVDTSLKQKEYFFLNKENVSAFMSHLKSSGFVNESYLNEQQLYFQKEHDYLEWLHEYDEIPFEYDVDPVIRYMDYDHVVDGFDDSVLEDLWVNGPKARVNIGWVNGTKIKAFLTYDQGQWRIDAIEYGPTNYR